MTQVPNEVSQLVANSGNNFHAKVARWLHDNEWHVVVSPYYLDQTQNKAREIDLIAEKLWPVRSIWGEGADDLAVRLFIECKFVPTHSVFWFADKDQSSAKELVCAGGTFPPDNTYTQEHHYLAQSPKVAKLFTTSNKAPESDPFYKALNQALNALVSMRGRPITVPRLRRSQRTPLVVIEFPVVVCSSFDHLFAVDFYTDSPPPPSPISENFQLEVRYAYIDQHSRQRDEYFLLDVVEFKQMEKFVQAVDKDANAAAYLAHLES